MIHSPVGYSVGILITVKGGYDVDVVSCICLCPPEREYWEADLFDLPTEAFPCFCNQ